ncbi:MAG: helix-turn-helix transcriptional regulator [Blastocatellia bacterium]|nr:helix-turn-helix transcriptional regulator [Blastocatellia bacterium]
MQGGQKLKEIRNRRNIKIREVEEASQRIARAKGDRRFGISDTWLTQLENGASEPSICKLFSLSAIYQVKITDLLQLYGVDADEIGKYETIANPRQTKLLPAGALGDKLVMIPFPIGSGPRLSKTSLAPGTAETLDNEPVPTPQHPDPRRISYGYIGLDDFTMYPLIRPGSFVKIDSQQNKPQAIAWRNEYERPIFFVELRDGYACGWCEVQGNHLLIIPHHSSPESTRRFAYPREAEIIGRVISFGTHCVDEEFGCSEAAGLRKQFKMKSIRK